MSASGAPPSAGGGQGPAGGSAGGGSAGASSSNAASNSAPSAQNLNQIVSLFLWNLIQFCFLFASHAGSPSGPWMHTYLVTTWQRLNKPDGSEGNYLAVHLWYLWAGRWHVETTSRKTLESYD